MHGNGGFLIYGNEGVLFYRNGKIPGSIGCHFLLYGNMGFLIGMNAGFLDCKNVRIPVLLKSSRSPAYGNGEIPDLRD